MASLLRLFVTFLVLNMMVNIGEGKLMMVSDTIDISKPSQPYALVLIDLSQSPHKILNMTDFPAGKEFGTNLGGCLDPATKTAFLATAGYFGPAIGLKAQIQSIDPETMKVTHTTPAFPIPGTVAGIHCDTTVGDMIMLSANDSYPDYMVITRAGLRTGVAKMVANVTTSQHYSLGYSDSAWDQSTRTLLWDWGFKGKTGVLATVKIPQHDKAVSEYFPYDYPANSTFESPAWGKGGMEEETGAMYHHLWGINVTYVGGAFSPPSGIPLSSYVTHIHPRHCVENGVTVRPKLCDHKAEIERTGTASPENPFYTYLNRVTLSAGGKSTYTNIGNGAITPGGDSVPSQMLPNGTAYTTIGVSFGKNTTLVTWDLKTGVPTSEPIIFESGHMWTVGPFRWYGLFEA